MFNKIIDWLENLEINLTEEDILEKLQQRRRWPKKYLHTDDFGSLELISYFSSLTHTVFRDDLFDGGGYLDYYKFRRYYDNGFTFMLVDILDLSPELRKINDYFQDNFGTQVQGNFYINGNKAEGHPSFESHDHNYDVFVKHIYGWSKWVIDGRELTVKAGDVVALPAGTMHKVVENSEKRLSLTINRL